MKNNNFVLSSTFFKTNNIVRICVKRIDKHIIFVFYSDDKSIVRTGTNTNSGTRKFHYIK